MYSFKLYEEGEKMKYVILLRPNGNIPFFEELKKMCIYEAKIVFERLKLEVSSIEVIKLGKADYLQFECNEVMNDNIISHLSRLSFYYSMFEVNKEGQYRPIDIICEPYVGEDLSVRLKYQGKTNETFTRMLINTALFSTQYYNVDNIYVLDPMCGKGTTLFEALIAGYHGLGVEQNKTAVSEMSTYFLRYLQEGKYKHSAMNGKAQQNGKTFGEVFEVDIAKTKEEAKNKTGRKLKVLRGDTTDAHKFFKKNSVHVIATDLPYGVQHIGKNSGESVRNLETLLDHSFKSWHQLLKNGGAVALSWNTYTNKREDLASLLQKNNFKVLDNENYLNFHHRVSQAINRDIIIGIKEK